MNILFITRTLDVTGSEIVLYNILKHANVNKVSSTIIVTEYPGLLLEKLRKDIEVLSAKKLANQISGIIHRAFHWWIKKIKIQPWIKHIPLLCRLTFSNIENIIIKTIRRKRIDLVYVNSIMFPEIVHFLAAHKIRTILHTHELEHMLNHIPIKYGFEIMSHPELILATSPAAAKTMEVMGRVKDCAVWGPGVDFETLDNVRPVAFNKKKKFCWLGIGYNDLNKNVMLFIRMAEILIRETGSTEFMWLGFQDDQLYDPWIREYCKKKGLSKRVKILGKMQHNEGFYSLVSSANAVAVPSFRESFSLASIEAIYLGKPVLAFANGGSEAYLNSDTGVTARNYDEKDFIQKARWLMKNHSNFQIDKMKKIAGKFSIAKNIQEWESLVTSR